MITLDQAQTWNAACFIKNNHILNENGERISFAQHRFMVQPFMDDTPEQAIIKCGQIGWSTTAILRAFHLAYYKRANIIYTLPSKSIVKDFVQPKVDMLIENNPVLKQMVGSVDSNGLKSVGDRFIYFRSSWDEASGIAVSAHILINDELDRSNPKAIRTYRTRLDAAKIDRPDMGWHWQFSNPTIPGFGVDEAYQQSDQKQWMIKCPHCNAYQVLTFPDNINFDLEIYICSKCKRELSNDDRSNGHWVKKYFGRSVSGYWISQLMAPWHSASKIIRDSKGDQSVFHNFTLGLPYQPKDQSVSRQSILDCIRPDFNPRVGNAMGVDQNAKEKHYVIGNKYGIFRVGATDSWEEIEALRNQYDAYGVVDANPYPNMPKKLAQKYRGKWFIHYYKQDTKDLDIVKWGEGDNFGVVYSDRTKIIDSLVSDITSGDMIYNMTLTELEDSQYIFHWMQMFRVVEETIKGIRVARWKHPEGKPDHFPHAHVYQKIAMLKTLFHGAVVHPTPARLVNEPKEIHPIITDNRMPGPDLGAIIKRAGNQKIHRDWKYK